MDMAVGEQFSDWRLTTRVHVVVDFSDMKTGDSVIIREYYRRRDD
jgi:hypothetical protein